MSIWLAPRGLHVARGERSDARDMAELHEKGFYRGWPASDFEAWLDDPHSTPAYVAIDKARVMSGFAMVRRLGSESELLTIAVAPARRGQGLGRALLSAAFADLAMTPVKTMFLEVDEANLAALRLYRGFGFEEIGRRKGYYSKADGSAATALVMRAPIG